MGILDWIVSVGIIGGAAHYLREDKERREEIYAENMRRENTPFSFPDDVPKHDFEQIVKNVLKGIIRIRSFEVDGPFVSAVVRSQSGISEWKFIIDYNDYGRFSGKYWLTSDNHNSRIPSIVADRIVEEIETRKKEMESRRANPQQKVRNNNYEVFVKQVMYSGAVLRLAQNCRLFFTKEGEFLLVFYVDNAQVCKLNGNKLFGDIVKALQVGMTTDQIITLLMNKYAVSRISVASTVYATLHQIWEMGAIVV
ncbi:MAG TPA: hypothetical protein DEO39_06655 [Clostridiales bacterium]|nr:hypothetical protein [Clostridiales bacterium]